MNQFGARSPHINQGTRVLFTGFAVFLLSLQRKSLEINKHFSFEYVHFTITYFICTIPTAISLEDDIKGLSSFYKLL